MAHQHQTPVPNARPITAADALGPNAPPATTAAVVTAISPWAPAAQAGLREGDWILSINGLPIAARNARFPNQIDRVVKVVCYFKARDRVGQIHVIGGVSLGVCTEPTIESADVQLWRSPLKADLLYLLWKAKRWESLLEHSAKVTGLYTYVQHVLPDAEAPLDVKLDKWCCGKRRWKHLPFLWCCKSDKVAMRCARAWGAKYRMNCGNDDRLHTPHLLYQGIALIELGLLPKGGLRLIKWYLQYYADMHTTEHRGVGELYLAWHTTSPAGNGNEGNGDMLFDQFRTSLLSSAARWLRGDKVALEFVRRAAHDTGLDFELPSLSRVVGHAPLPSFVGRRVLPTPTSSDQETFRSDADILAKFTSPHQVHLLVLLGNYRVNGPYDEYLKHVLEVSRSLSPNFLTGCTVLTMHETPETIRRPQFASNEKKCLEEGRLAFNVVAFEESYYLEHVDAAVERVVGVDICGSPFHVLVDARGNCKVVGNDDDATGLAVELWNAVGEAFHELSSRPTVVTQQQHASSSNKPGASTGGGGAPVVATAASGTPNTYNVPTATATLL